MPHADVNGQQGHFEDTGDGGPAVVLAHGVPIDDEMFTPRAVVGGMSQGGFVSQRGAFTDPEPIEAAPLGFLAGSSD